MKRAALASTRSSLSRGSHGDGSSPTRMEHGNYDIKASSSHIWCSAKFPTISDVNSHVSPSLTQNARRSPHSLWATIRLKPMLFNLGSPTVKTAIKRRSSLLGFHNNLRSGVGSNHLQKTMTGR